MRDAICLRKQQPWLSIWWRGRDGARSLSSKVSKVTPRKPCSNTSFLTKVQELYLCSCLNTRATRTRLLNNNQLETRMSFISSTFVLYGLFRKIVLLRGWKPKTMEERLLGKQITMMCLLKRVKNRADVLIDGAKNWDTEEDFHLRGSNILHDLG